MDTVLNGILLLFSCLVVFTASFFLYKNKKNSLALGMILLGGLILRIYIAADPYLHEWDEKYHAVIAKNMVQHPMKPTLYEDPVIDYDLDNWVGNHVWLHKGPIPLWAISLSIQCFGPDLMAIRIPSILLSLLSVYLSFLIGKHLFDTRTGLLAAFFHTIQGMLLELTGGRLSSDHVETFFLFFISLSIYLALISIKHPKKNLFIFLAGTSIGMAFLCKWVPAFIVVPVWLTAVWVNRPFSLKKIIVQAVFLTLGALLVILPWLIYIHIAFPAEFNMVFSGLFSAYSEVVQNHQAPFYFYLLKIGAIFGEAIYIPLILGIYFFFAKKGNKNLWILTIWWILPFFIFSFAETKRITYLMISAPAILLIQSYFMLYLYDTRRKFRYSFIAMILVIALGILPVRYSLERLKPFIPRKPNPVNTEALIRLEQQHYPKPVLFNYVHAIEAMYYTNITAYTFVPDETTILELQAKGHTVIMHQDDAVPEAYPKIPRLILEDLSVSSEGH